MSSLSSLCQKPSATAFSSCARRAISPAILSTHACSRIPGTDGSESMGAGSRCGISDFDFSAAYCDGACEDLWGLVEIGAVALESSCSIGGTGSRIACSGTVNEVIPGRPGFDRRSFRGESPRSILEVLNLTLPEGERGGVMMLSPGSSEILVA